MASCNSHSRLAAGNPSCSYTPIPPIRRTAGSLWCRPASQHPRLVTVAAQKPHEAPSLKDDDVTKTSQASPSGRLPYEVETNRRTAYPLIAVLASVGALETAYLTAVKLFDSPLVCPTDGCGSVLNSSYSSLFGIPLAFFGCLTYGAVATLAVLAWRKRDGSGTSSSGSGDGEAAAVRGEEDATLNTALAAGATVLASTSAVLVYLLNTEFAGSTCVWCYLSAGLSASLLVATMSGMSKRQLQEAAAPGIGGLAATVAALYFGFGSFGTSSAGDDFNLPYSSPAVTQQSSRDAVALAAKLKNAGAKMYGAFWCSHCFDQKQAFGQEAMATFPYVECFPEGWKRGTKVASACDAAGIKAFPTWVINGRNIEGQLALEEVEAELKIPQAEAGATPAAQPVLSTAAQ